jgi:hypothetical protein
VTFPKTRLEALHNLAKTGNSDLLYALNEDLVVEGGVSLVIDKSLLQFPVKVRSVHNLEIRERITAPWACYPAQVLRSLTWYSAVDPHTGKPGDSQIYFGSDSSSEVRMQYELAYEIVSSSPSEDLPRLAAEGLGDNSDKQYHYRYNDSNLIIKYLAKVRLSDTES